MPAMDPALRDADKENAAIARAIRAVAGGSLNLGPGGGPPRETPFETRPSRRRRPAAAPAAGEITAFDGNRPRTPPRAERRRSTSNGLRTDLEAPKRVDASAPASPWAPGSVGCDAWGADADVDAAGEPRMKRREKRRRISATPRRRGRGRRRGRRRGGRAPPNAPRVGGANRWVTLGRFGSNRVFRFEGRSSRGRESARGARARSPYAAGHWDDAPEHQADPDPRSPYAERARERRPLGERRAASARGAEPQSVRNPRRARPRRVLRRVVVAGVVLLSESSPETDDASSRPCGGASRRRRPRRRRRRRR